MRRLLAVMFGADWCRDCVRAKAFFDNAGGAHDYIDIEAVEDGADPVASL